MSETAAWRDNCKEARSTEGASTSDKCRISIVSSGIDVSVTFQKFFLRGGNTAMKINGAIAGDSETGREKLTARQWTALILFCGVETWK